MKTQTVGGIIAAIFVLGLIVELALYWKLSSGAFAQIWEEEAQQLLELILALYAVPLGVICGGALSIRKRVAVLSYGRVTFFLAAIILWNILVMLPELNLVIHPMAKIAACVTNMRGTADKAGFLITGVLAFFFSTTSSEEPADG